MSDHKISEFRERAQAAVTAPDADLLLYRGRALRRRRQLAPVVAVAACAVIGIGFLVFGGGDARTGQQPIDQPTVTETHNAHPQFLGGAKPLGPGTYALDLMDDDGQPEATVELVGCCWESYQGGAHIAEALGTVSWGFQQYGDTIIDRCSPEQRATSRRGAITQLSTIPGTVTRAARPVTKLGLSGTYMQLSIPVRVKCSSGPAALANLMAIYPPPTDPTVTVDVWLLEDGDRLLILTQAVRGNPSPARLKSLDRTLDTLQYVPAP
jgi:hypothetical protein